MLSASTLNASTTTNSDGEYCFEVDDSGTYKIEEEQREGWAVADGSEGSYTDEFSGENPLFIDFYNYEENDVPNCGDGTCSDDENCSTCSDDCGACYRSSGGGGGILPLRILDEEVHCTDVDSVELTWRTNFSSTGQVVYGNTSNPGGIAPTYGYDFSAVEDSSVSRSHSVVIDGLASSTYYFKAISASAQGDELAFDVGTCQVIVKGAEGAPVLEISKESDKDIANPGDEIEFTIVVKNTGNLTAYGVSLQDILPKELKFVEFEGDSKTWDLGDLGPGESIEKKVKTIVSDEASSGTYLNNAKVSAINYTMVSASDDYKVQKIAVLAETGFDSKELLLLIISLVFLSSSALYLRRKIS